MDEHDVGIAAARGIERLPGALRHHLHLDAGLGLEHRQDVAEQAGILRRGGRGHHDRFILCDGVAGECKAGGRGDQQAAREHVSSMFLLARSLRRVIRRRGTFWPRRFAAYRRTKRPRPSRRCGRDEADDVAGKPARLAEIMGRHHDLDAAAADSADDVFDRLGGDGIEARGRLVEEQHGRIARQRPRQRQPLLLAAGQPSRGAVGQMAEADQFEQFVDARARVRRAACRRRAAQSGYWRRRCGGASPGAETRSRASAAGHFPGRPR